MSLLFAMPSWESPSELWMQRMLLALEDSMSALACWQPPTPSWKDRIPTVRLVADSPQASQEVMRRAIDQYDIRHVFIHYLPFALAFGRVWEQTTLPVHVHCHGYDVTWDRRRPEPPHERHFDEHYPERVRLLSRRAWLIANSQRTAERLQSIGVERDRIIVKYLGVPVPDAPPRRDVQRADGAPVTFLFLGRLVDFKGPDLAIEAFDFACEQGLNGRLVLAGDGPLMDTCRQRRDRSRHADKIELLGSVDAPTGERLRREADVFIAHHRVGPTTGQEEAFGVSIVEAMAAGLPVLSARSGSLPELITDDVEGLLVESGDTIAQAQAMLDLTEDDARRHQLGYQGWCRSRQCFQDTFEREALRSLFSS